MTPNPRDPEMVSEMPDLRLGSVPANAPRRIEMLEEFKVAGRTFGYDLWNEGNPQECHCAATQVKFRQWLRAKYGTIEALGRAWHRYSLAEWDYVHPPRGTVGFEFNSSRSGCIDSVRA